MFFRPLSMSAPRAVLLVATLARFSRVVLSLAIVTFAASSWAAAADEVVPPPAAADAPIATDAEKLLDVDEQKDLVYYDGPDAHAIKHKLDLFTPRDTRGFPTVLFIHGGAWTLGDKSNFGIYSLLGRMLARHGIGCAVTNYRLSPDVKHPEHIKDVARSFAWLHDNIARYGGSADKLFVSGHSAGGHLAALLASDESYLKAEGRQPADIQGVIAISGVYDVPGKLFKSVFGDDEAAHRAASPIEHANAACPPMLLIYAEHDFPLADRMALDFAQALKAKGATAETLLIEKRNHIDIIAYAAKADDPTAVALMGFVRKRTAK